MKFVMKLLTVLCVLQMSSETQAVLVQWVPASAGDWTTAANWDTGNVPAGGDDTRIQVGGADVTLSAGGAAHRLVMDGNADLTIGAGGSLADGNAQTLIGNTQQGNIVVDGGSYTATGGEFYFGVSSGSTGTLTINSGTVTHTGAGANSFRLANSLGSTGEMTVNGGTFSTASHLRVGLGGTGTLTVNGGNVSTDLQMVVAGNGGSFGNVNINGGVTTVVGLNFAGAGTETLDLTGGQLITTGGFSQSANSTFNIGSGELIFNGGQTLADINNAIDTGAGTWIFDQTRFVFDSGSGIVVTSIPEPASALLMGFAAVGMLLVRRRVL